MRIKLIITATLCVFTLNSWGQSFDFDYQRDFENILARSKKKNDSLYYLSLLPRFQTNDTTLSDFEIVALLIGFTASEHYKPYQYLSTEQRIYSLNGNGEFAKALTLCDSFLYHVPVSQEALIEKSYAYYKLGKQDSADFYSWKFNRIMQAMYGSNDGRTLETAMFSLGPTDGQNFIRRFLRAKIGTMGSGRDQHGNFVDILEMTWEDEATNEQKSVRLYFQIEHATKIMFDSIELEEK